MRGPGRPRKYATDAERAAAVKKQKGNWHARNASKVSRRRRDRRAKGKLRADKNSTTDDAHGSNGGELVRTNSIRSMRGTHYSRTRLGEFIDASPDHTSLCIKEYLAFAIDGSPQARYTTKACKYWAGVLDGLTGRLWGEFVYDSLAHPNSERHISRMEGFEGVSITLKTIEDIADDVLSSAFDMAPDALSSSETVAIAEARRFRDDVTTGKYILDDILSNRRFGLAVLLDSHCSRQLHFQRLATSY
ncbi:hypothetical protein SCHPADRAFT_899413 [Schizopora paradoxa]|uniref:Uncharacterized protein n=1 Tax=Schizopora paradoxa TaxID=27342 RepID=A0A0H2SP08_9AGAM|nr:hypothetical protein SCHPADRAFT_899413 [Schizopora paradoxa]